MEGGREGGEEMRKVAVVGQGQLQRKFQIELGGEMKMAENRYYSSSKYQSATHLLLCRCLLHIANHNASHNNRKEWPSSPDHQLLKVTDVSKYATHR